MEFAQSSFVFFNHSLQDAIRSLHRCGYSGIEIWGGRPHMYRHDLDSELKEIKALLDSTGMRVPNFIPAQFRYPSILGSLNEQVRHDSVEYIKSAMDNAIKIGAPSVSLCAGMTLAGEPVERGCKQLRKSIMELLEYRENAGLKLLIEPAHCWESTLVLTVDDGLRMINEIRSERLGICLDTGHANVNGEAIEDVVRKLRHVPLHIHIDDNRGDSDTHLIPGDGTIDFAPLVKALQEINYKGFVSAELGFQYTLDPDSAIKKTYDKLQTIFST